MKKSNTVIFSLVSVAACGILLTGCLGGNLTSDTLPVTNRELGMFFSCSSFNFLDNGTRDVLDKPINLISKAKINEALYRRYPSVFSNDSRKQAIPININIKQRPEDLGALAWVIIPQSVWLFASLGLLPAYFPTMDFLYDIEVEFNSKWGKKIFSAGTLLTLHENYWLGSFPFFYAFYTHGQVAVDGSQRILQFRGGAGQCDVMKSNFVAESISDSVVRLILNNRKELLLKILNAEVENRWGLLAGYETENALYSTDDARIFQRTLISNSWNRSRIKTLSGKRVLKNELEGALENYLGNAKKNDIVLLFMSGEIYQDPARPDDVYFVCADTDKRQVWTGYKLSEIFAALKEVRTSNVIIMLDVCRKPYSSPILTENYLRRLEPSSDWLIVSNETVKRADSGFSGPLVNMLRQGGAGKADADGDRIISLRELTSWLRSRKESGMEFVIIDPAGNPKLLDYPLSNR